MAKQRNEIEMVEGKYQGNVTIEQMSVKGGDLPDSFQVYLNVEIDFEGADPVKVAEAACGGQSLRVVLQSRLRKEKTADLTEWEQNGYKIHVNELLEREGRVVDPVKAANNAVEKMTDAQRQELIAKLRAMGVEI
jgi:hypothetical protein